MKRNRGLRATQFAAIVFLLVAAAILHYPNLASAQQESTPSVPVLTAQAGGGSVDLAWDAVPGAARYELWVWDAVNEWEHLAGTH